METHPYPDNEQMLTIRDILLCFLHQLITIEDAQERIERLKLKSDEIRT